MTCSSRETGGDEDKVSSEMSSFDAVGEYVDVAFLTIPATNDHK